MQNRATGWTPERRKKQSEAIRQWKPWNQSTGAKSLEGKAVVSRNAWKGGHGATIRQITKELNDVIRDQRNLISVF